MKIRKGDTVQIIAGKDKRKSGAVVQVLPDDDRIVVEGVNVVKRHKRAEQTGTESGIIEKSAPIHVSNAMLMCPQCKLATRVGYVDEGGKKVRKCKKCNKTFE